MKLTSPDELIAAGKKTMLNGREPKSRDDWGLILNFAAANIIPEVALSACILLARIYDIPLTDSEITAIVTFQIETKGKARE